MGILDWIQLGIIGYSGYSTFKKEKEREMMFNNSVNEWVTSLGIMEINGLHHFFKSKQTFLKQIFNYEDDEKEFFKFIQICFILKTSIQIEEVLKMERDVSISTKKDNFIRNCTEIIKIKYEDYIKIVENL